MTTYRNGLHGGGIFIDEKYPNERHVHGFQYLGPWTRTDIRLSDDYKPKAGEEPINKLDTIAMNHDIAYAKVKKEYQQDGDKQKALNKIHESDRVFINDAAKEGALGKVASTIMYGKMKAEQNNIIDSNTFSGMGNKIAFVTKTGKTVSFTKKTDPTARLKKLAGISTPKKESKKKIKGGMIPLAVGVISALAGTALGKKFDLVKEKIQGKGYAVDPSLYTTDSQKREFLKRVLY